MALVITAPELLGPAYGRKSIFLAGAIDMGAAVDWQQDVVDAFAGIDVALFNPRRAAFTPDTLDEQIRWELAALDNADAILMWLPGSAKAPVSMFEAGLFWRDSRFVIGADPAFYRRRNLELTGEHYDTRVYASLGETMAATKRLLGIPR